MKECPVCFGLGMIEHKRCKGIGCDGCIEGELICPKCSAHGVLDDNDNVIADCIESNLDNVMDLELEGVEDDNA